MSSSVVSTTVSNTTESLSGIGDDLLVTSLGSIVETNGIYGVDSTASGQAITVDGLVYSADAGAGVAVHLGSTRANLLVDGQVMGDTGVFSDGSGNSITVGSQGSIDSVDSMASIVGTAVYLEGPFNNPTATGNTLTNNGDVSAGFSAAYQAVSVYYGGDDLILNSGRIEGAAGINFESNAATETVENSGTIQGGSVAAIESYSSTGVDIDNSGLLTDGSANSLNSFSAVLYFDDNAGTTSVIDNQGTITGAGYVIQSASDLLDISNSGTIHGGLYSTAAVSVYNAGLWQGQDASNVTVFSLSASGNSIANSKTGAITGALSMLGGADTIANAGSIDGAVTLAAGNDALTNTGIIDGAVSLTGTGAANALMNSQSGTMTGAISITGSSDRFDNAGAIDGAVTLLAGGDVFTNSGAIDGAVTFTEPGTGNKVTNSGSITGNVTIDGGNSAFSNSGSITGSLLLTTGGTATNTGTINGNVTLVGTSITVDTSRGKVTGAITASSSDTFDEAGLFGTQTINSFIVGGGATHDTIQFAANDFGTFAAVQAATTQVGSDTLIKLGANDTITLVGVTASSLVAADFKFV